MTIRDYTPGDAATLVSIFQAAVLEGSAPAYDTRQRRAWAARLDSAAALHDRLAPQTCLVAQSEGRIQGFIALEASGHLDMLFVRPDQRRTGTAGALHDTLLDHAMAAGHAGLSVHASHLARRFLEKRGWTYVRTETVNLHGVTLEHHYMMLQLRSQV